MTAHSPARFLAALALHAAADLCNLATAPVRAAAERVDAWLCDFGDDPTDQEPR